jgi:hypothetical protein
MMKNKSKYLFLIITLGVICFCAAARAQTNTAAGTIFSSIASYFTSFNTNYTWAGVTIEADSGYAQVTGVNASSKLNVQYDIGNFDVGTSLQFSGVGSAINAWEGQVGYAVVNHYDTKVDVLLRGGYDDTTRGGVIEPGISLKKKLSENTYAETAITFPIYTAGTFTRTPTIYIGVGFTF